LKEFYYIYRIITYDETKEGVIYLGVKNRLKEIRMREYMMTQTEFSKVLGYDLKTVSNWERGLSTPILERALNVSRKLNKNVNEIWYLE